VPGACRSPYWTSRLVGGAAVDFVVVVCPSCGAENPDGARFCNACATPLEAPPPAAEERKVVSVLFVDLVGFTARSDEADPEDVRATLRPYHAGVKREIERFGGTVEKFIGDAVMAVFGAPVAHEDDPERAVRAALRVLESIGDLNEEHGLTLAVRAAVATGEAVVSLGARPGAGEGIATGDVVNVAARLQGEAPVGGLVVNEHTFRATRSAIDYEELEPVSVKGKVEPLPLWKAVGARSRFGVDAEAAPEMPFVGREHEARLLRDTFERTLRESTVQLVTVIGEPGVGKTRLLAEFRGWLDDRPELVYWRQGRCLPYGEGIAFWGLGEIVKAHAGLLESDDRRSAEEKLRAAVDVLVEEGDRDWMVRCLSPLVGLPSETPPTRDESFAAWQSCLEGMAAQRPLVLLFEDLHWGDTALLDFVERLVDWSSGLPILVLCSARPELYDLRAGWGGGKRNASTVSLSPLTREETARLVSALLASSVLPAVTQEALLERSGGNPLYAEEYVRLYQERGSTDDLPLPETVQGLIAARIDSLSPERKSLLHDASVIGKIFWAGALEAMGGGDGEDVRVGLHQLSQRELVRPQRRSSVEGQAEFSFWHALVRDVAYGQIPRAARAVKHLAAADWIEEMAAERLADHADLVAHHLTSALTLAEATEGRADPLLTERTARALVLAGDRAASLDVGRAEQLYRRALELVRADSPERGHVLIKSGESAYNAGHAEQGRIDLGEAASLLEAAGDVLAAGRAHNLLARLYFGMGGVDRMERAVSRAIELLERLPPGPDLVSAYGRRAVLVNFSGGSAQESLVWADKAIELAAELGVTGPEVLNARAWRGFNRCEMGDLAGVEDVEAALALALEHELPGAIASYVNLADVVWRQRGPASALALLDEGVAYAVRRGGTPIWAHAESCWMLYDLGRWGDLTRVATGVRDEVGDLHGQPHAIASTYLALVLVRTGARTDAAALMDGTLADARAIEDPQCLGPALVVRGLVDLVRGDSESALARIEEWSSVTGDRPFFRAQNLTDAVRIACAGGDVALAERLLESMVTAAERDRLADLTARATIAEAQGDMAAALPAFVDAAEGWRALGCAFEHGLALLASARCDPGLGRGDSAGARLDDARAIFSELGAQPLVAESDDRLGTSSAAGAD
jgi:class 3 adenylate cyclase/tetratricopeptide (TPR) repeat protein